MNSTLCDEDGSGTQQLSPGFHIPRSKTPWSFRPDRPITQPSPEKNLKLSPHLQLHALPIVPSWHHRITFFFWCCQQWKICQSTQVEGSARKHGLTDPSLEHVLSCAWLEARVEGHQRGLVPRPSYSATPKLVLFKFQDPADITSDFSMGRNQVLTLGVTRSGSRDSPPVIGDGSVRRKWWDLLGQPGASASRLKKPAATELDSICLN